MFRFVTMPGDGIRWIVTTRESTSVVRLTGCTESALQGVTTRPPTYRSVRTGLALEESLTVEITREQFAQFAAGNLTGRVCGQSFQLQAYQVETVRRFAGMLQAR